MSHGTAGTVRTAVVEYDHGGTEMRGFLAYDEEFQGRRPGVLVFPEWWGVNGNARDRARRLAALGYVAFVADVYGDGRVIGIDRPADAAAAAAAVRADPTTWRGRAGRHFGNSRGSRAWTRRGSPPSATASSRPCSWRTPGPT